QGFCLYGKISRPRPRGAPAKGAPIRPAQGRFSPGAFRCTEGGRIGWRSNYRDPSGTGIKSRGKGRKTMSRRELVAGLAAVALGALAADGARAQDAVKIGLILPMTGQQTSTGKQIDAAVRLFQQQNGTTVAGKKVEVILKDDAAVP